MLSTFDIVMDTIGEDNAKKLQNTCGGMVFYIPLREAKKRKLLDDYTNLRKVGNSHNQAVQHLAHTKEVTARCINNRLKKLQ